MQLISVGLMAAFSTLALIHLYWAMGGKVGIDKVLPEIKDGPSPGPLITVVVAKVLTLLAGLALLLGFPAVLPALEPHLFYLGIAAGGGLILRSVGEFKYVGFFKREYGSDFATYDSWIYSPFCLLAGLGYIALSLAL